MICCIQQMYTTRKTNGADHRKNARRSSPEGGVGSKLELGIVGAVSGGIQMRAQELFGQGKVVFEHGGDDADVLVVGLDKAA